MRVGIYGRLSMDRDGTSTGTARQLQDCRDYAERRGWEVVDTFEELDVSAFNGHKRLEFERIIRAIEVGAIDGVVVWKLDRLSRQMRDFVRVVDAAERRGAFVASAVEGVSTNEPTGQFVAQLMTAQAQMESHNASIRQRRKHEERAAAGLPHGGGIRMFGMTAGKRSIVPDEAALIRDAARRIIEGSASIEGICREWNAKGITTTTGRRWQRRTLWLLLQSPTLSGQRAHRGEIVGEWGGPSILTKEEGERLRAVIAGRSLRGKLGRPMKWLLSGIARCSLCGGPLAAGRGRIMVYRCHKRAGTDGCGKITVARDSLDQLITEAIIYRLATPALREAIERQDLAEEDALAINAIGADEEALVELSADYYQHKRISRAEFFANRDAIEARLEANRARVRRHDDSMVIPLPDTEAALREHWEKADVEARRQIIGAIVSRIIIKPGRRGARSLDPSRIEIEWKA